MKRLSTLILLGAVILGMVVGSLEVSYAAGKKEYEFVWVFHATGIDFAKPVIQGVKDAGRLLGVEARVAGPVEVDIPEQVAALNATIDAGVDGIIVSILDPKALDEAIQRAMDKGIPVIAGNVDDNTPNARMAFVGANLYQEGQRAGELLIERASLRKGDKVGLFMCSPHISLRQRCDGIRKVLDEHGVLYDETVAGEDMTKAIGVVESYYLGHPDVKALYGADGITTPAIAQFLKSHPELWGKVHGCGHDLIPLTLEGIKDGYMDFTMDQQPYLQGFYPVIELWLYHEYGIYPASVDTGGGFVDRSNVEKVMELAQKGYR